MKKLYKSSVIVAGVMAASMAFATNIGVVNMKNIFHQAPQVKSINAQMKKKFASKQARIEKLTKTLQADVQKLQKNRSVMTKKQLDALNTKVSKEADTLHNLQSQYQNEVMSAREKALGSVADDLRKAAKVVAGKEHLDLIIAKSASLYAAGKLDVTKEMLAQLKKQHS